MASITKKQTKTKVDSILSKPYVLFLENDDYNSFEWVITCLIKVCGHDEAQATQCAHIVHFNGRCDVKYGDEETITKMKDKLKGAGLCATMEKN